MPGPWKEAGEERVLRTSPEQNSENISPSSESERCESFLDFDVRGIVLILLLMALIALIALTGQGNRALPRCYSSA